MSVLSGDLYISLLLSLTCLYQSPILKLKTFKIIWSNRISLFFFLRPHLLFKLKKVLLLLLFLSFCSYVLSHTLNILGLLWRQLRIDNDKFKSDCKKELRQKLRRRQIFFSAVRSIGSETNDVDKFHITTHRAIIQRSPLITDTT